MMKVGSYNEYGIKEVGNSKDRSISDELDRLVHNFGMEYWYGKYFAIRTGFYYDKTGKISNPTFGIGLRFSGMDLTLDTHMESKVIL